MKIISLSFFSDIWIHSYPEFLIYKNLNEKFNFDIDVVNCENFFFKACAAHNNKQILLMMNLDKRIKFVIHVLEQLTFIKKKLIITI